MSIQNVIDRQPEIAKHGKTDAIKLPKFKKYTICNLRGGIGKTTLAFNLSYLADNLLAIDTCPQGNLSYYFDNQYYANQSPTVRDMVIPHLIPGLGSGTKFASKISATNGAFTGKNSFFIRSSDDLYLLPSQLTTSINQVSSLQSPQREQALNDILFSLKTEIERELQENKLDKCLIDTSPFFAGATQLSWYAADAMIIPVRTDQQSINSLELLINTLKMPGSEFRKHLTGDESRFCPKLQMVVLTHCGWSTQEGNKNVPNKPTKIYLQKVHDIISRNISVFSTDNPDNHLLILDDFLGSGRISSAFSTPINLLRIGESRTINRLRVEVSASVEKCQQQLRCIHSLLW